LYHAQPPPIMVQTANFLPPYAEAIRLVRLYPEQAPCFFWCSHSKAHRGRNLTIMVRRTSRRSIPPADGLQTTSTTTPNGKSQQRAGTSHDLALLFIVFCFGALTDIVMGTPSRPLTSNIPDRLPTRHGRPVTADSSRPTRHTRSVKPDSGPVPTLRPTRSQPRLHNNHPSPIPILRQPLDRH
jgi:hypothetical protein